jgi:hypothetical protein
VNRESLRDHRPEDARQVSKREAREHGVDESGMRSVHDVVPLLELDQLVPEAGELVLEVLDAPQPTGMCRRVGEDVDDDPVDRAARHVTGAIELGLRRSIDNCPGGPGDGVNSRPRRRHRQALRLGVDDPLVT